MLKFSFYTSMGFELVEKIPPGFIYVVFWYYQSFECFNLAYS